MGALIQRGQGRFLATVLSGYQKVSAQTLFLTRDDTAGVGVSACLGSF